MGRRFTDTAVGFQTRRQDCEGASREDSSASDEDTSDEDGSRADHRQPK